MNIKYSAINYIPKESYFLLIITGYKSDLHKLMNIKYICNFNNVIMDHSRPFKQILRSLASAFVMCSSIPN